MRSFVYSPFQITSSPYPFYPTIIIIQARMGSTRLKGKTLKSILGRPMLYYLIERLRAVPYIDAIIVATTKNAEDDAIEEFCKSESIHCVRGSTHDVLSRFYAVIEQFSPEIIVRITADCPLISPKLLSWMLSCFSKVYKHVDFLSNTLERTFPRGLDIEIVHAKVLQEAYHRALDSYDREHVMPYIVSHPEKFSLANVQNTKDVSDIRITVDTIEDFQLVEHIFSALYNKNHLFDLEEIIAHIHAHPELLLINAHIQQKIK